MKIDPGLQIERLLQYGLQKDLLDPLDIIAARNGLLDLFRLSEPYPGVIPAEKLDTAVGILVLLVDYAAQSGLITDDAPEYRALFDNRIMGLLMPRPSEIASRFDEIRQCEGIQAATDYFYKFSIDSNYIRMAEIRKNVSWTTATEYGDMEITINLTKPEKDPRQIALDRKLPKSGYPLCHLCVENVGYAGRYDFPARQTLRIIPVTINREPWYFQYSPYVYFPEHSIVMSERHEPMMMNRGTFEGLLDFVGQFPHYFCGSNAELPIVGGSILNHNHFQGGRYTFPLHRADTVCRLCHPAYDGLDISILHWPLSALRVTCKSREILSDFATHILAVWRGYDDPDAGILAWTGETGTGDRIPHSTVTPIARIDQDRRYEMIMILRNNRTNDEYPDGIFHPHPEIHPVKKENIGLIEAMGMAILPGRLLRDMDDLQAVLTGRIPPSAILDKIDRTAAGLREHAAWICGIIDANGCGCPEETAAQIARDAVGRRFTEGLEHTGVFRQSPDGIRAFVRFMAAAGCRRIE